MPATAAKYNTATLADAFMVVLFPPRLSTISTRAKSRLGKVIIYVHTVALKVRDPCNIDLDHNVRKAPHLPS